MNEFATYQPSSWMVDGFIVNLTNKLRSTIRLDSSRPRTKGKNVISNSAYALLLGVGLAGHSAHSDARIIGTSEFTVEYAAHYPALMSKFFHISQDVSEDDELNVDKFLALIEPHLDLSNSKYVLPASESQLLRISSLLEGV